MNFEHNKHCITKGLGTPFVRLSKPVIVVRANHWMRGFSLVELMIALVLGLLLIGAVVNVFISNRQTYRTTENMARLQENARFAFELLEQDIREAGGIPCGGSFVDKVTSGVGSWWDWNSGTLRGFDGTQGGPQSFGSNTADRVTGTDAILVLSATRSEPSVITKHDPANGSFTVDDVRNISVSADGVGDIVMACDGRSAAIFQVASATNGGITYNSTTNLGHTFASNGMISEYSASFWYIGNNGRGGQSLYRLGFSGNPGALGSGPDEMVDGINNMQIEYLIATPGSPPVLSTSYVPASSPLSWDYVVAVRVSLTLTTGDNVGTDGQPITRTFTHNISLRDREFVS